MQCRPSRLLQTALQVGRVVRKSADHQETDCGNRNVDVEDPTPSPVVDQPTTDDRTEWLRSSDRAVFTIGFMRLWRHSRHGKRHDSLPKETIQSTLNLPVFIAESSPAESHVKHYDR